MIIFDKEGLKIEIEDTVLESFFYLMAVSSFVAGGFYKRGDYVIPTFSDGITFKCTGQPGISYRLDADNLVVDFIGSRDVKLTGDLINSVVLDIKLYKENNFIGSFSIAFVRYIVVSYVIASIFDDENDSLQKYKRSRYVDASDVDVSAYEDFFRSLYGMVRQSDWNFDTYQNILIRYLSILKWLFRFDSGRELAELFGFVVFEEDMNKLTNAAPGFDKLPTDNWEVSLL